VRAHKPAEQEGSGGVEERTKPTAD